MNFYFSVDSGGPSLVAALVSTALLEYVIFPPRFSWSLARVDEAVSVGLVLVVGVLISLVAGSVVRARHQARRQAEAQAAQLRTILETLVDGLFVTDEEGSTIQQNKAARALLGQDQAPDYASWSAAERVAQLALRDAQGQPLAAAQLPPSRVLRGEVLTGEMAQELWVRTLDGREVVLSVTGAPIRTGQGQMSGAVLLARDVTERRQLERRTQHALDALIQLAHTLVATPVEEATLPGVLARQLAAFTTEALEEERVLLTSRDPETDRLYSLVASGFTPEQEARWRSSVEGTHLGAWCGQAVVTRLEAGEVVCLAAADAPPLPMPRVFGVSQRLLAPLLSEHRLIGVLALGRAEWKPLFTPHEAALLGAVAQFCALVLERERVLQEREEARAHALALSEANRQMDAFVGMVSHELRTPLTSLKLSLQLIQRRLERTTSEPPTGERGLLTLLASLRDFLTPAERQTLRLERLIQDLLDAARIREGTLELRLARTDLNALVQEVVAEQRALTPERVIAVQTLTDQPLLVQMDGDRIRQAVVNYPDQRPEILARDGAGRGWCGAGGRPGARLGARPGAWHPAGGAGVPLGTLSSGAWHPGASWPGGRARAGTLYHQNAHRAASGAGRPEQHARPGHAGLLKVRLKH